ncbi:MAG: hypothetical protein JXR37_14900 [Kiritimatiellae bacterium]|nr:hypothetical protein [Kiritimatiellia bacterium]
MPILAQDRREYVREVTELSLWLAQRNAAPGIPFETTFTNISPVYRLTVLWDGAHHPAEGHDDRRWTRILRELNTAREGVDLNDSAAFEEEGLHILWPYLEPRIEKDVAAWPWIPSTYGTKPTGTGEYGFFLYEIKQGQSGEPVVDLHMGNALAPDSPFRDLDARVGELVRLLDDAQRRAPSAVRLESTTWLNGHGTFLGLFPAEWARSPQPEPLGYAYNWWGQFVNRRGGFHQRNGARLRESGRFPYPCTRCECRIESLRRYLCEK